jgi:hypothetical protein
MKPREIMEIRNLVDRAGEAIKYFEEHAFDNQKELLAAARHGFDVLKRQRDQSYAEADYEAIEMDNGGTIIDVGFRAFGNIELRQKGWLFEVVLSPFHRGGLEIRLGSYVQADAEAIVKAFLIARGRTP